MQPKPGGADWHIGDGYGGYECDLGSGATAAGAWKDAAERLATKAENEEFERGRRTVEVPDPEAELIYGIDPAMGPSHSVETTIENGQITNVRQIQPKDTTVSYPLVPPPPFERPRTGAFGKPLKPKGLRWKQTRRNSR